KKTPRAHGVWYNGGAGKSYVVAKRVGLATLTSFTPSIARTSSKIKRLVFRAGQSVRHPA
ncbi:hypothetical protein, partial [Streptococcus suis]|uniref:hypothetical protein n=1 Tax=Streptococcus suis TaxID=1307 RepID=UPI001CE2BCE4